MGRADIHFHLLPGIDDGPRDMAQALALAADAAADGTTRVVATPHVRRGHVQDVLELPERIARLRDELRREGIALTIELGGELGHPMVARLRQDELETIAQGPPGGRWILLEAPFAGFDEAFHDAADELRDRGFGVVIAHPERALGALEDGLKAIRREVVAGSALQLNVWSLAGRHGEEPRAAALRLVREGLATVIASDAHADWRRPLLSRGARSLLDADLDPQTVRRLSASGPQRLLESGLASPSRSRLPA